MPSFTKNIGTLCASAIKLAPYALSFFATAASASRLPIHRKAVKTQTPFSNEYQQPTPQKGDNLPLMVGTYS